MSTKAKRHAPERRARPGRANALAAGALALCLAVPTSPSPARAQTSTAPVVGSEKGQSSSISGRFVNLSALPQASSAELASHPQPLPPLKGFDANTWASIKRAAALSAPDRLVNSPAPINLAGRETPGAATLFTSSLTDANCGCTPADQAIAVGDTNVGVLQGVNTAMNVYDKFGNLQAGFPKSLTTFFNVAAGTPTSDPRAMYDWVNHRYIVVMIDFSPNFSVASHYNIAVSTGDSPNGGYCTYQLPVQSVAPSGGIFPLPDFPRIGQDRQAIYLASNIFNTGYKWEEIMALPKAQMYACQGFNFSFFSNLNVGGTPTDTTQPVNVFAPSDNPRSEYMVTSKNIFFGQPRNGLVVWAIHSPLSSPTLTGVVIGTANSYSVPPNASQPGSPNSVDTGDNRISGMAMYNAGSIYASINAANGARSEAILYQIEPFVVAGGGTDGQIQGARLLNEFVHGNSGFDVFYATQQPDPEGNVTYVWNYSDSSSIFPSLAYNSRRAGQPVGTEPDGGIFAAVGQALYVQGRWGDYTAVAPGGLASGGGAGSAPVMWFAGMFARSGGGWGTTIGRNGYSSITQP